MAELAKPIAQELLTSPIPARMAYTGLDGAPRAIPIGYLWNGTHLIAATVPTSAKVAALAKDPRVALTIDTNEFPPKVLLIRGKAQLEQVEGVPDDYLEASRRYVGESDFAQFEAGVRALYDQMTVITIVPEWAKLLDFETTLPKAVADLVAAKLGNARD
jgi:hypothetical protein